MSDFTQAQTPSEGEMANIRNIFERAANAIVQASELAKQVGELTKQFESLRNDMESMRRRNQELDTTLADVRSQRDTAMSERDHARESLPRIQRESDDWQSKANANQIQIDQLRAELAHTKADRDQAYDAWHKAEQAKEEAETKLSTFQSMASTMFGLTKPEPVKAPEPTPPEPVQAQPEPPKPTEPAPSFGQPGFGSPVF